MSNNYSGFISYSQKDSKFADWLQKKIETFRIPKHLRSDKSSNKLKPVFRDRDEMPANTDLGAALRRALEQSDSLIVILSCNSIESRWVDEEIRFFSQTNPHRPILFIRPDTNPDVDVHPSQFTAVQSIGAEPLYADSRKTGDGRFRAWLKIVAGMLGLGFDQLYKRQIRRRNRNRFSVGVAVASLAFAGTAGGLVLQGARDSAASEKRRAELERQLAPETEKLETAAELMRSGAIRSAYTTLRTVDFEIVRRQERFTEAHAAIFEILMHDPIIGEFRVPVADGTRMIDLPGMSVRANDAFFFLREGFESIDTLTGKRNWSIQRRQYNFNQIAHAHGKLHAAGSNGFLTFIDGEFERSYRYPWRGQASSFIPLNDQDMYLARQGGALWYVNPPKTAQQTRLGWKTLEPSGADGWSYSFMPAPNAVLFSARVGPEGQQRSLVTAANVVYTPDQDEKAQIILQSADGDGSPGAVRSLLYSEEGFVYARTANGGYRISFEDNDFEVKGYNSNFQLEGYQGTSFIPGGHILHRASVFEDSEQVGDALILSHDVEKPIPIKIASGTIYPGKLEFLETPLVAASVFERDIIIELPLSSRSVRAFRGFLGIFDGRPDIVSVPEAPFELVAVDPFGIGFRFHALFGRGGVMVHGTNLVAASDQVGELISMRDFDAAQHLRDGDISDFSFDGGMIGCRYNQNSQIEYSLIRATADWNAETAPSNMGSLGQYHSGRLARVSDGFRIVSASSETLGESVPDSYFGKRLESRLELASGELYLETEKVGEDAMTIRIMHSGLQRPLFEINQVWPDSITCADVDFARQTLLMGTTYHLYEFSLPNGNPEVWIDKLESRLQKFQIGN